MTLYRVLPYLANAAENEPGGVFFCPAGGKNRADAADGSYRCLYLSDSAEGSIAERFGRFDFWDAALVETDTATPIVPRSHFALAAYELPESIPLRELDDAHTLLEEGLRPSDVVTRNRDVTQGWAMRIHEAGQYAGVSWWSYYHASWHSLALWDLSHLALVDAPRQLHLNDAVVESAAGTIVRRIVR